MQEKEAEEGVGRRAGLVVSVTWAAAFESLTLNEKADAEVGVGSKAGLVVSVACGMTNESLFLKGKEVWAGVGSKAGLVVASMVWELAGDSVALYVNVVVVVGVGRRAGLAVSVF